MITDKVDSVVGAVNDVNNSIRHTSILQQVNKDHASCGIPLRGLHDVRVATDSAHGEHPEGDHGGEVERCNTGTNSQWCFVRCLQKYLAKISGGCLLKFRGDLNTKVGRYSNGQKEVRCQMVWYLNAV